MTPTSPVSGRQAGLVMAGSVTAPPGPLRCRILPVATLTGQLTPEAEEEIHD
jgi:hypothetical protein